MRILLALAALGAVFASTGSAHQTTGVADYSTAGRALLNDHVCFEDEYKFIPADGDRVRCVPRDGGFPRLAPHG